MGHNRKQELTEQEIRIGLLLRQMRETIQYAYDASECLDAAINRYAGSMAAHYKRELTKQRKMLLESFTEANELILAKNAEMQKEIEETINRFAGVKTNEELLAEIGLIISRAVKNDVVSEVAQIAADTITPHMLREIVRLEINSLVTGGRNVMTSAITGQPTAAEIKLKTSDILDKLRDRTRAEASGDARTDDRA